MKIYLDSCIVIYLVESHQIFASKLITKMQKQLPDELYYSPMVRLECLVLPLKNHAAQLVDLFLEYFDSLQNLTYSSEIFDLAAQLRADHKSLKTPDAIHLATALHYGCDEFWTNDDRLAKIAPTIARNILTT